jgi:hypothetical protein
MSKEFADYLQRRIDGLERSPGTWGDHETQETMMITLLEIQAHYLRPKALKENPFEVREFWSRLVSDYMGFMTNWTLVAHLDDLNRLPETGKILGAFARAYQKDFPPEEL